MRSVALAFVALVAGCGAAPPRDAMPAPGTTPAAPRAADDASRAASPPPSGVHLPAGVRPTHYAVSLELSPERERFRGRVAIDVELARPTLAIWMNGVDLHVTSVRVAPAAGPAPEARWEASGEEGLAALRLAHALGPGRATLTIEWDAAFAPRPGGLFHRRTAAGWAVFSRFEAAWARHALPCFDDPALPAPFDVNFTVPRELVAFANTPAASSAVDGAHKSVRFATTPPLAPHELRWAVGALDVAEPPVVAAGDFPRPPIALRGAGMAGTGPVLGAALAEAEQAIRALEHTLGGAAPFGSFELVATPGVDEPLFVSGGDDGARAVVHAVAETWARRLVRPDGWDELWLREALAGWMADQILDTLHPQLGDAVLAVQRAAWSMGVDALPGARPVRARVESNADVAAAFDPAAWDRGAAVLGMIEGWIGSEAFRGALRDAQGPGRAAELFAAWSAASGQDVSAVIASFVDRAGVPVVEVRRECEAGRASLVLHQSRWRPVGSTLPAERTAAVPVCVTYAATPTPRRACVLLEGAEGRLPLEGASCEAWVMPNGAATGVYRWALPLAEERKLVTAAWPALSARERVAVALNLAAGLHAGTLSAADVLSLLPILARARERAVVEMPMAILTSLADGVVDEATRPRVNALGRRLHAPVWARLGWQAPRAARPDPDAAALRGELGRYLALVTQDPTLRTEAAFKGRAAVAGGTWHADAVAPELRDVALAVAAEVGDAAFFDGLVAIHDASRDPELRRALFAALGRTRDPALARRALDMALDPNVPLPEAAAAFAGAMQRRENREIAWEWLRAHARELHARAGDAWSAAWTSELAVFCDEVHADDVQAAFGAAAAEPIRRCAALAAAQRESAARFFRGGN